MTHGILGQGGREGSEGVRRSLCMCKVKNLTEYFIIYVSKWFRNVLFFSPLLILQLSHRFVIYLFNLVIKESIL